MGTREGPAGDGRATRGHPWGRHGAEFRLVNVRLSLFLPRDSASVPMARRVLSTALDTVGVTDECRTDILLALAEACANAVAHATPADSYQVTVRIDDAECQIEVVDAGAGFDYEAPRSDDAPVLAESGRGLYIIRSLADDFDLRPNSPTGTLVRFVKRLERAG
jgi:serine/threonine-protein kinase RsbW